MINLYIESNKELAVFQKKSINNYEQFIKNSAKKVIIENKKDIAKLGINI